MDQAREAAYRGRVTKMVQDLMVAVEEVRDAFHRAVYADQDLDAALTAAAEDCVLLNLPGGSGAKGRDQLAVHLTRDVFGHLPVDLGFSRISRTVDRWRVAEEATVTFTHDRELPWLLPGVAATHRRAEVLVVSVVTVNRSLVSSYRALWDRTSLVTQLLGTPP
jgi:carboxymethylenebutenolidase